MIDLLYPTDRIGRTVYCMVLVDGSVVCLFLCVSCMCEFRSVFYCIREEHEPHPVTFRSLSTFPGTMQDADGWAREACVCARAGSPAEDRLLACGLKLRAGAMQALQRCELL